MQSKVILGGFIAASVLVLGIATPITAQQADAIANLAEDARELAAEGAWRTNVTYAEDDLVTARGSTWRSKHDNNKGKVPGSTQPSTAGDWELFAAGLNPTGAWRGTRTYHRNDLVTHIGETWCAKRTSKNKTPAAGANWEKFAAAGDDGTQGPQGIQGVQGIQGPPGPNMGVPAGTAAAPAISFSGDSDTGIFSPEAGKIALVENGALFLHNKGTENTALGVGALQATSTGIENTALGQGALGSNVGGNNNTAVGFEALANSANATNNVAVGRHSMRLNVSGSSNVAVGFNSLASNISTGSNTAVGDSALQNNTAGSNTGIGNAALFDNTSGTANTALGASALNNNTTASFNTGVGSLALLTNTTGFSNTAVGGGALSGNTSGSSNTAVGNNALNSSTTGSSNIAIGNGAADLPTAPANSIFIGNPGLAGDTATIKIGVQGGASGQTSTFIAGISGAPNAGGIAVLVNASGQLSTASSSRRYKENIETLGDVTRPLMQLRPVRSQYKRAEPHGAKPMQYGLIAEEAAEVLPDLAYYTDGQLESVKYHFLAPILLAGHQQQQKVIEVLTERDRKKDEQIASLEQRLRDLEARMSRLASR